MRFTLEAEVSLCARVSNQHLVVGGTWSILYFNVQNFRCVSAFSELPKVVSCHLTHGGVALSSSGKTTIPLRAICRLG